MRRERYHDIMNSVSVIKNMTELLLDEKGDPLKRDILLKINARAERLVELMR